MTGPARTEHQDWQNEKRERVNAARLSLTEDPMESWDRQRILEIVAEENHLLPSPFYRSRDWTDHVLYARAWWNDGIVSLDEYQPIEWATVQRWLERPCRCAECAPVVELPI